MMDTKKKPAKATGKTVSKARRKAAVSAATDEVLAAIAMALYEEGYNVHDENPKLTIRRSCSVSAWSLKTALLLERPQF